MKTKVCNGCRIEKSVDDFYKNSTTGDGIGSRCKECERERMKKYVRKSGNPEWRKAWESKNKDKRRAYERTYQQKNPMNSRKKAKTYYDKHPVQLDAKRAVRAAIRRGILPNRSEHKCANPDCNKRAEQYHHWSYEKEHWLSVIPLCKSCHSRLHGGAWQLNNVQESIVAF